MILTFNHLQLMGCMSNIRHKIAILLGVFGALLHNTIDIFGILKFLFDYL